MQELLHQRLVARITHLYMEVMQFYYLSNINHRISFINYKLITKMLSKPLLGYWDIRGVAEPIRLMLEYSQVKYEQKLYKVGPAPEYKRNTWFDVKESLDLDFPNLPYYIDGDLKICESWAIMKHIAQSNHLLPEGKEAISLCNQAEGVIQDFRFAFVMMCYQPDDNENKNNFFGQLAMKMTRFDKYLAKHKWMAGEKITYVDFAFCEILDQLQIMEKDVYSKYPNINEYLTSFMNLDRIVAYRRSSKFKKFPCNNPNANWPGGDNDE